MLPLDILKFLSSPIVCIPSNNVEYSINNVNRYNCGVIWSFFCNQDESFFHTDKNNTIFVLFEFDNSLGAP